jgi:hypothetical protein
VSDAVALRVDNNHGAATKDPETNRPHLTIVSSSIGDLNRGACEDALRIEEVQASLLEGAQALAGIKADHHAAWQVPSCPRGQHTWIVIASGKGMLNEQVPPPVTPRPGAGRSPADPGGGRDPDRLLNRARQADGGQGSPSTASPATTRAPTAWWAGRN